MDTNKILSADFLDLIFDDRNKEYGAYELRRTYNKRISKALALTALIMGLVFTGTVLASNLNPDNKTRLAVSPIELTAVDDKVEKPKEIIVEKKKEEVAVKQEKLTNIAIVDDPKADDPPPTQDDLDDAKISDIKLAGVEDDNIVDLKPLDKGKDIIEGNKQSDPGPFRSVEVEAKFLGNWEKFLLKNLNGSVPNDNSAPMGRYRVLIQFVVDLEGNVSDIKALTNYGYGMEQEAIRVLKKATKWEPAFQNGSNVIAYRTQPITFVVDAE